MIAVAAWFLQTELGGAPALPPGGTAVTLAGHHGTPVHSADDRSHDRAPIGRREPPPEAAARRHFAAPIGRRR
jgi:hypothetical protein